MKRFFTLSNKFVLWQLTFMLLLLFTNHYYYTADNPSNLFIYFVITIVILILGTIFGTIVSLGGSLLIMFLLGSYLFWKVWTGNDMITFEFLFMFFMWFVVFIVASIISGQLRVFFQGIILENKMMHEKFEELVSIDPDTGFDIEKRFLFELEEEFKRSQRYKQPLTILLIEIEYFDQFLSMYGESETRHVTKSIANGIRNVTRISDKKFRIANDIYAIMLTNTPEEHAIIVMDKIHSKICTHALANGKKQVTLTIAFGYSSYQEHLQDYMEMYYAAQKELSNYIH